MNNTSKTCKTQDLLIFKLPFLVTDCSIVPKGADLEMLFNIRQTNGDWASIPGHGTPVNKCGNLELTIYRIKSTSLKSKFYIPQVIIYNLQVKIMIYYLKVTIDK